MGTQGATPQQTLDGLIQTAVEQYRSKLLDLSSRNPLVNFRHSDRSRTHIRVIHEIPEILFKKLEDGKELSFDPVPEPLTEASDESTADFEFALKKAKKTDQQYIDGLAKLGPSPSNRQKRRLERSLRDRLRTHLGMPAFSPATEPAARARDLGIDPSYDLPASTGQTARHFHDSKVQTLFFREDMDRKLSSLRDSARVLLNDAGLNALYCAFGFLEYYESVNSDERRIAPLVFFPVEIDRTIHDGEYRYQLKPTTGDIEVNVALLELLKKEHNLELPTWTGNENGNSLATYFESIKNAISNRAEWQVRRYVTVGLFTFSTLAMYRDLDPRKWRDADAPMEKQPLLKTLVTGAEIRTSRYAEDYQIDSLPENQLVLVTDADASQQSAVVDVLNGKNCVIQGPPGTGKSQTITNMIAAAMYAGKSVLFIAEKMAALEVVAKRLRAAGLEHFCLELHSTKTTKSTLLSSLRGRLDYLAPRHQTLLIQSNMDALQKAKKELLYYVQKMNEEAGSTGLTIHQLLLGSAIREIQRPFLPEKVLQARLNNALGLSPHQIAEMKGAAAALETQALPLVAFGKPSQHPWRGFENSEITDLEKPELQRVLREWTIGLSALASSVVEIETTISGELANSTGEIETLRKSFDSLPDPAGRVIDALFPTLNDAQQRASLKRLLELAAGYKASQLLLSKFTSSLDLTLADAASLTKVFDLAAKYDLAALTICELPDQLKTAAILSGDIEQAQASALRMSDIANIDPDSCNELRAADCACDLAFALPRELWSYRQSQLTDEKASNKLKSAISRRDALRQHRRKLEAIIDLASLPPVAELNRLAFVLSSTNPVLAIFNGDCRQAKKLFRFASRDPHNKASRNQIVSVLKECSSYLANETSFVKDQIIKGVSGSAFNGLESPFDDLLAVAEWVAKVKTALLPFGPIAEKLCQLLFASPENTLTGFTLALSGEARSRMQWVLVKAEESRHQQLAYFYEAAKDRRNAIQVILEASKATGLFEGVTANDFPSIVKLVEASQKTSQGIKDSSLLKGLSWDWNYVATNYKALEESLTYSEEVSASRLPRAFQSFLLSRVQNSAVAKNLLQKTRSLLEQAEALRQQFEKLTLVSWERWAGKEAFDLIRIPEAISRCEQAESALGALGDYIAFLQAEESATENALGPILNVFSEADWNYENFAYATDFVFYRSAAEQILALDPKLKRHAGATHEQLRQQFQDFDKEYLRLRSKALAIQLCNKPIPPGNSVGRVADLTDLALVEQMAGQTKPRTPIRELFGRASKAIQGLKPCWMMSPMSVAQFLHPGKVNFDLVVMDEASQIRPEEALGALVRGNQLVVVGDNMQLPPTSFFQKLSSTDNSDSDDEEEVDVKQESILEAAASRFHPSRRLRWHYRSEHGSLIDFSNHEFYSDDLTVFPSPQHDVPEFGVKLVQISGQYHSGLNQPEATAVIEAALKFMKEFPKRSLGIVAVNSKQSEFLRETMDRAFADNPSAEAYRAKWEEHESGLESFFVKNLENVQGDERDVIFISTVYGPDKDGNFHQRFGPINSEYGHRRLNVLFTRAKKQVVLFTSMRAEDIQEEGKSFGVRALKGYIQYARDGRASLPDRGANECDSEFELWVLQMLKAEGYDAIPQLGYAGYKIDIAVKHPDYPGKFICAVECDGATYHSARSVRERDRLRQEVLERLGWKIYRIWSTDWFKNPSLETSKLTKYLKKLTQAN